MSSSHPLLPVRQCYSLGVTSVLTQAPNDVKTSQKSRSDTPSSLDVYPIYWWKGNVGKNSLSWKSLDLTSLIMMICFAA